MNFYFLNLAILVASCIWVAQSHGTREPLVSAPFGTINGTILTSRLGKPIYSFRGIRYAQPPVNDLRFQPPVPIEKVDGVYDATIDGPSCPQPWNDPVSEDCLMLNVYSTKLPHGRYNPKRPVIVHIHPGGFYSSTGVSYWSGPQYFLDQDIVLVTFNWRIGSLGFLSTGDKLAPGNNGLKDQVVVLKWIQKNIEAFGGDPNSVTLHGYSAGAWSIVLHMVSPMSKGLFHKAASLSGSPVGVWPLPRSQMEIAKKQARLLNCPDDSSENIIKCLKTKSAIDIGNTLLQFREFGSWLLLVWSPVIEPDFGQERFLTDHPIRLITKGQFQQMPFLCGRTKDEFNYYADFNILNNETATKLLNDDFEKYAPLAFFYERETDFSKNVSKAVRSFYFKDGPIDRSQESALKDLYEDVVVGFQMHRVAKLMSQYNKSPVWYYRFSYQGSYSNIYVPGTNDTVPYGVVHHDDLIYMHYISRLFPYFKENSPKEVEMVVKLTTLYANFAKTGNPTPTRSRTLENVNWEPYKPKEQKYLDIGQRLVMKEKLNDNRFKFWENLYPLSLYSSEDSTH